MRKGLWPHGAWRTLFPTSGLYDDWLVDGRSLSPCGHVSLPILGFSEDLSDWLWLSKHFLSTEWVF